MFVQVSVCSQGGCLLLGGVPGLGESAPRGCAWSGGCLIGGVCASSGGCLVQGGCLVWGVCFGGGCAWSGGLVSQDALRQTPSPRERWLLLRTVRILLECILVGLFTWIQTKPYW